MTNISNLKYSERGKKIKFSRSLNSNDRIKEEFEKQKELFNSIKQRQLRSKNFKCPLLELCPVCINSKVNPCCLFLVLNENIPIEACIEFNCASYEDCRKAMNKELGIGDIPNLDTLFNNGKKVDNPLNSFNEKYYPLIEIKNQSTLKMQTEMISKQGIRGVAISLQEIFDPIEEFFIKTRYFKNLHEILEFDGEIILTTNIQDQFCKILVENANKIPEMLTTLKPTAITSLDFNFYMNQPTFINLIQLDKIFNANNYISDSPVKQIGLVPPSQGPLFQIELLSLLNRNYKTLAVPLLEINSHLNQYSLILKPFKRRLIRQLINFYSRIQFEYILLSTSPHLGVYANSFSSLNWFSNVKGISEKDLRWNKRERNLRIYQLDAKKFQPEYGLNVYLYSPR